MAKKDAKLCATWDCGRVLVIEHGVLRCRTCDAVDEGRPRLLVTKSMHTVPMPKFVEDLRQNKRPDWLPTSFGDLELLSRGMVDIAKKIGAEPHQLAVRFREGRAGIEIVAEMTAHIDGPFALGYILSGCPVLEMTHISFETEFTRTFLQ